MQGLSVSQWIIIAVVVVLVAGASSLFTRAIGRRERRPKSSSSAASGGSHAAPIVGSGVAPAAGKHQGLKGWLLVLGILIFASPLLTGAWLWNADSSLPPGAMRTFPVMVYGQRGIYLTAIALEIATIICLARRSRRFKPVYILTSIVLIMLLPAVLFWDAVSIALEGGRPFTYMLPVMFTVINVILCVIFALPALIWLIYVLCSRRVTNTFVN